MILLLIIGGVSCKKALNQEPTNAVLTENAFETVADFDAATKGMYFEMVHADNYLAGEDAPIAGFPH